MVSNVSVMHSNPHQFKFFRSRVVAIVLSFVILTCLSVVVALQPNFGRANSEQYRVFSDYLEQGLTGESHSLGSREGLIVIDGCTKGGLRESLLLIEKFSRVRRDLQLPSAIPLLNLLTSNVIPERLQESFGLSLHYELMTDAESKLYPYEAFWKRFPGNYGYQTFTRVGFNPEMTQAVFYTEHICGMCGEGKYVYMQKRGEKWVVVHVVGTWIS
jgi:hypothetical protein